MSYLVELKANQTGNKCCGGCNSWNDLSSNKLGLVAISRSNTVVDGTQIGCGGDEINVEVGVIVFLKLGRRKTETSKAGGFRKVFDYVIQRV